MTKFSKISLHLSLLALLVLGVAAQPAFAGDGREAPPGAPELYSLDSSPEIPGGLTQVVADAEEQFSVDLDPERVAENPEQLTFELPFGPRVEAYRELFTVYGADWKSWSGALYYPGVATPAGHAVLVYHGDHVSGIVNFEEQRFQLAQAVDGGHRLVRLSEQTTPVCALHGHTEDEGQPAAPEASDRTLDLSPSAAAAAPESTRIDVLALYTKDFFSFPTSEVGVINFVQDSISIANSSFANSNVSAFYNLVYVGALLDAQPPATGLIDDWAWINGNPSEMVGLRSAFGADMVALMIPFIYDDDPYCGIANLPRANGTITPAFGVSPGAFGDRAYTVQRDGCGLNDYTFAHELGHNYGMRHDTGSTNSTNLFPNGRGYVFTASGSNVASAMGCYRVSGPITGAVCSRIPYFSDPAVSYQGSPTGTSTRNNANVGRVQKASYAAFRAVSSNSPPNPSFTVGCNGNVCTFNASGSSDPGGSIVQYRWHFGDGGTTTTASSVTNHTYSYDSFFWIRLEVEDNGGQRAFAYGNANPVFAPEISVVRAYDGQLIPDGGSVDLGTTPAGSSTSLRFRIDNTGNSTLTISNAGSIVSGSCFQLIETPSSTVFASGSTYFRVRLLCDSPGLQTGSVSIINNDSNENPYNFTVTGTVQPPEIAVVKAYNSQLVPDGGSVNIGTTTAGASTSLRFRIDNSGSGDLVIGNASSIVSGTCFHLIETPSSRVGSGGSTYFRVRLLCGTPGSYAGTVSIDNNDPNEDPYNFTVTGTVN